MDKVNLNDLGMLTRLEMEVDRFNKFQSMVFNNKTLNKKDKPTVDMRVYAKYVLKEGSVIEKRELLANLRSKITLKDKVLTLAE